MTRRVFTILLTALLVFSLLIPGFAGDNEAYTYTIRIFGGNQGTMLEGEYPLVDLAGNAVPYTAQAKNGGEYIEFEDVPYGYRVSFRQSMVSISNSGKYHYLGIRESGKDNNTIATNPPSFPVNQDWDFVVAYGINGDTVAYHVSYVDLDGNELAPSETYYGNVGEKPVIAYLYIAGYQPDYYNRTFTLDKDETNNYISFRYKPIVQEPEPTPTPSTEPTPTPTVSPVVTPTPTVTPTPVVTPTPQRITTTTVVTVTATPAVTTVTPAAVSPSPAAAAVSPNVTTPATDDNNPDAVASANPGASPSPDTSLEPAEEEATEETEIPFPDEPEEILDMDVPLAEPGDDSDSSSEVSSQVEPEKENRGFFSGGPGIVALKIIGCLVGLGLIIFLIWLLIFKRRKKDEEEQSEDQDNKDDSNEP